MEKNKRLIEWAFEQVMLTWQDKNVYPLETVNLIKSSDEKGILYQPYSEVMVTFANKANKANKVL